jgi:hypothetical protein
MPIQHTVLALLANGPSYGYSPKGAFEANADLAFLELAEEELLDADTFAELAGPPVARPGDAAAS